MWLTRANVCTARPSTENTSSPRLWGGRSRAGEHSAGSQKQAQLLSVQRWQVKEEEDWEARKRSGGEQEANGVAGSNANVPTAALNTKRPHTSIKVNNFQSGFINRAKVNYVLLKRDARQVHTK